MKQPASLKQMLSSTRAQIIFVSIFLAILLFTLGILLGLLLRQNGVRVSMLVPGREAEPALPSASPAAPTAIVPALLLPTRDCSTPTLVLGATTFQLQAISPSPDGSIVIPSDTSGIAYRVEGTEANPVFVLSPAPQNRAVMQTVSIGSPATVTREDCSATIYSLSAPEQGSLDALSSPDPSTEGITVFFQADPAGAGFVFHGDLAEETITAIDTPRPDESGVLAEIGLLEVRASDEPNTINVSVSIYNYGEEAFTLEGNDVLLTQADGRPLSLLKVVPRLPERINPGVTKTFELTFRRPASETATLKIFTVEYDIEGY